MVRTVVVDGMPPPVWAFHSQSEKISGSAAVPPPGAPQATVAVAETLVESTPITGANQCCTGLLPVTVTVDGLLPSCGGAASPPPTLAVTSSCAVARMLPQAPSAQLWATASVAASAA